MLAWNLLSLTALVASLWLIARGLHVRLELWMAFAMIALGLLANPLRQQVNHGQLNLLLLLIIVLAWTAHRQGHWIVAGSRNRLFNVSPIPRAMPLPYAMFHSRVRARGAPTPTESIGGAMRRHTARTPVAAVSRRNVPLARD